MSDPAAMACDDLESACCEVGGTDARARDLLDCRGAIDAWHRHENQPTEAALRAWARDNNLLLDGTEGTLP